jgi:hypothetical protein
MDIHPVARRHDVADEDIRHVTANAIAVDGTELAIHAMKVRPKYKRLLPGG